MPIAAVPHYLGQDFKDASPGLRFGPLLAIWTTRADQEKEVNDRAGKKSPEALRLQRRLAEEGMDAVIAQLAQENNLPKAWTKNDHAAKTAWERFCALNASDKATMPALLERQKALFATLPSHERFALAAKAIAPFTTGLGNEHPLENGFAFLSPYGLPYLPGSGVKGVLRQAARELASGEWGEMHGWSSAAMEVLFGLESQDGDSDHLRGVLSFWDVYPQLAGHKLMVEIMTPHQGHYYQQRIKPESGNSATPHDSGQPNPIHFLTVPPGSGFSFFVTCDTRRLEMLAPELLENERWKALLQAAFEHAFLWLGFGAKTAVGYGVMQADDSATAELATQDAQTETGALSEAMQKVRDFELYMQKRLGEIKAPVQPNQTEHNKARELANLALNAPDWNDDERRAAAEAIRTWLPKVVAIKDIKDELKKLKLKPLLGNQP